MNSKTIFKILGVLVSIFGVIMISPAFVAIYYGEKHYIAFIFSGLITSAMGITALFFSQDNKKAVTHKEGFIIVTSTWILLGVFGALPFLATATSLSIVNALFESASGLTTTGATILLNLDTLPRSILFWRSLEEWIGGMGIILLAIAVMPLLGIGGVQLFKAEGTGLSKDKIGARVSETAKMLWFIYLAMTIMTASALYLFGMSGFDAVNHAMTTIAIGGFSTHDESIAFFKSEYIRITIIIAMFLAGVNFSLHFFSIRNGFSIKTYLEDDEFVAYFKWVIFFIVITAIIVWNHALHPDFNEIVFNVISIVTTTGFSIGDYTSWSPGVTLLFLFAMFAGACAGSTGGGIKIVRVILLVRQCLGEIKRAIHPHEVITIKLKGHPVPDSVLSGLWGFFVLYIICFAVIALVVATTGVDFMTSISASAACITNTGPGFGQVGPTSTYTYLPDMAKMTLIFAMFLGRVEVLAFFIILTRDFWKD